jgi:hypothetical protein
MTITTVSVAATALTLAAFAFLSVAAISATSMLSPMQEAIAQEQFELCVTQHGGPPKVLVLEEGDVLIGVHLLPPEACARGAY